jgi:hypothetical protein
MHHNKGITIAFKGTLAVQLLLEAKVNSRYCAVYKEDAMRNYQKRNCTLLRSSHTLLQSMLL